MERWITVKNHPLYEVNNKGEVRNKKSERMLKPYSNREGGYLRVELDGKQEYIHRLVVDAFFDGDHSYIRIKHVDGNRKNNNLINLSWRSAAKNVEDFQEYYEEFVEEM